MRRDQSARFLRFRRRSARTAEKKLGGGTVGEKVPASRCVAASPCFRRPAEVRQDPAGFVLAVDDHVEALRLQPFGDFVDFVADRRLRFRTRFQEAAISFFREGNDLVDAGMSPQQIREVLRCQKRDLRIGMRLPDPFQHGCELKNVSEPVGAYHEDLHASISSISRSTERALARAPVPPASSPPAERIS